MIKYRDIFLRHGFPLTAWETLQQQRQKRNHRIGLLAIAAYVPIILGAINHLYDRPHDRAGIVVLAIGFAIVAACLLTIHVIMPRWDSYHSKDFTRSYQHIIDTIIHPAETAIIAKYQYIPAPSPDAQTARNAIPTTPYNLENIPWNNTPAYMVLQDILAQSYRTP